MLPGAPGAVAAVTARVVANDVPQAFDAVTETVPLVAVGIAETDAVVDVPVQPEGSVHVYDVAPVTAPTEYVCEDPAQTVVAPLMLPGADGAAPMLTPSVDAVEVPHVVFATTETVPPVPLGVRVMLLVVLVPVQPVGSVQV